MKLKEEMTPAVLIPLFISSKAQLVIDAGSSETLPVPRSHLGTIQAFKNLDFRENSAAFRQH